MAIIHKKEMKKLGETELKDKLKEIETELSRELGAVASGTKPENPGRIRELKRTKARILTILHMKGASR